MTATVSRRAAAVVAHRYDDFPVEAHQLDLRGDNSPPLGSTTALLDLATDDVATYGDITGNADLRETLAEIFGVQAEHVIITAGGSEALHLALTCVTDPGDTVLLPRPAFPGFEQVARLTGLRVTHYDVPGTPPRRQQHEPLLICTPHNPTGVVTDPGIGLRDDGWTIWDISHMSLAGRQITEFTEALADHDIIVFSLSKLLRLPGARVGCLVATDAELLAAATRAKTHLSMSTGRLGQQLAARMLRDPATATELRTRTATFAAMRARLLDAVTASRGLTAVAAADGTHVWLRTRDGSDAWRRLADAGLIGLPGVIFNGSVDTVRLCIAQSEQVIDHAAAWITTL